MKKKGSLSTALLEVSSRAPMPKVAATSTEQPRPAIASPSREGKKAIAGFFDPAVSRQLKEIGLERGDISVQDLLREALNDLFTKHGRSAIA